MISKEAAQRLRTANSLADLHEMAHGLGLDEALGAPLSSVLKALPDGARFALESCVGGEEIARSLDLRDVLSSDELLRALKRRTVSEARAQILSGFKAALVEPRPAPAGGPRQSTAQKPPIPTDPEKLLAWAVEQGIPEAVEAPLSVLGASGHAVEKSLRRSVSLKELLISSRNGRLIPDRESRLLTPLAVSYLERAAEEAKTAVAEEAAPRPPPLPALARFADTLARCRVPARQHALPTSRAARALSALRFEPDQGAIAFEDSRPIAGEWKAHSPIARLFVESWETELIRASCSCGLVDEQSRCRHILAAIDSTLDACASKESLFSERLREFLSIPGWTRALTALANASLGEAPDTAPEERRLVWRVEHGKGQELLKVRGIAQKRAKKGGGWTRGAPIPYDDICGDAFSEFTPADRRAAAVLQGRGGQGDPGLWAALSLLAGQPNVVLGGDDADLALKVEQTELVIACAEKEAGGFELFPATASGERLAPAELVALRMPQPRYLQLDPKAGRLRLIRAHRRMPEVLAVLSQRATSFPASSAQKLSLTLRQLAVPTRLPERLLGHRVAPDCRPVVACRLEGLALELEVLVRPLPSGLSFRPGEGPPQLHHEQEGQVLFCERDFAEEQRQAEALYERLSLPVPERHARALAEGQAALCVLKALEECAAFGLEILWPTQRPRLLRAIRPADVKVVARPLREWFGLSGDAQVDGERLSFAALMDAARNRQRFVALKDGAWAELSRELSERLAPLADLSVPDNGVESVSVAAVPLLKELAKELSIASEGNSLDELMDKLERAQGLEVTAPEDFRRIFRPYQAQGFEWLARLSEWAPGCCLADDMGLGKTLQALGLLSRRAELGPALVLAPVSVCSNWEAEARRFAPGLRVHLWHRCDRAAVLRALSAKDVLVMSYNQLVNEVEQLSSCRFATAVFDEAQALKNAASQRAQAARRLNAQFKLALSGTPLENHLGELWSLYRVVFPSLLGSEAQFRTRFWGPIEKGRDIARRGALSRILSPFLLRRTKSEVAKDLPDKVEVTVPVGLSEPERALYEEARLAAVAKLEGTLGPEQRRFAVLAELTRLRQLACHPKLHDPTWSGPASKLSRALELVEELRAEGHRMLVFSQFTSHLALVKEALVERGVRVLYLDGDTREAERQRRVEAFQRGEGDVFLISLKAGGTGLNLTAADNVLHLDPWWNPAVEDQATDRAHRIGQVRKVTVYRLVTTGTVEEQILALHSTKRELARGILEGKGELERLSVEQLAELIRFSADPAADAGGHAGLLSSAVGALHSAAASAD